ncbi:MAG: Glu/Leu/Phe/Val dehydrogenase, partial [Pseudomonadota bacterium]
AEMISDATNKRLPSDIRIDGEEKDLVHSGLEETMAKAFHDVHRIMAKSEYKIDMRTAAFKVSIEKIAISYLEGGFFP